LNGHYKLKKKLNGLTLADVRDRFLEPFGHVSSRIKGITRQICGLNQQQRELTVERLKGVLKEIVTLVMEEPPRAEEPKEEQPRVLMCRGVCAESEHVLYEVLAENEAGEMPDW
jgi:hypothetical protein